MVLEVSDFQLKQFLTNFQWLEVQKQSAVTLDHVGNQLFYCVLWDRLEGFGYFLFGETHSFVGVEEVNSYLGFSALDLCVQSLVN